MWKQIPLDKKYRFTMIFDGFELRSLGNICTNIHWPKKMIGKQLNLAPISVNQTRIWHHCQYQWMWPRPLTQRSWLMLRSRSVSYPLFIYIFTCHRLADKWNVWWQRSRCAASDEQDDESGDPIATSQVQNKKNQEERESAEPNATNTQDTRGTRQKKQKKVTVEIPKWQAD